MDSVRMSLLEDIVLKIYGFFIVYLLGIYELLRQYIWLYNFRTNKMQLPDEQKYLRGRTVLVTGGLGSIGMASCKRLLQFDSKLIIWDVVATEEAGKLLSGLPSCSKVTYCQVDLSDLSQVKSACEDLIREKNIPNVLLFNAGVMQTPYTLTKQGYELQLAVNYLGHLLILSELTTFLPPSARTVFVTSVCHKANYLNLEDIHASRAYSSHLSYSQAKLCQLIFSSFISSSLMKRHQTINCVHPGIVNSSLYRFVLTRGVFGPLCLMYSSEACRSSVHACLSSDLEGRSGLYLEHCLPIQPSSRVSFPKIQDQLFQMSCSLLEPWTDMRTNLQ